MQSLYLAGPYGFSAVAQHGISLIKTILELSYKIIDPFLHPKNAELGKNISELQESLQNDKVETNFSETIKKLHEINQQIGENNAELIRTSDVVLAYLNGPDVDSGTAAEIGYAYGLGKKIYGFRDDFRLSGDNYGSKVNLQVEYFINASGGKIFTNPEEFNNISV
jgi:nucleoside 2-deoxyribosyltransferase